MEFHYKLPENVMNELTTWYHGTLIAVSVCMIVLAAAQVYTLHATSRMRKQCVGASDIQANLHGMHEDVHRKWRIAHMFAEICHNMPPSVHLTKLVIDPAVAICMQGTVHHDVHALSVLLALCARLGFAQMNTVKTTQADGGGMTFDISAGVKFSQDSHDMVYL